MTISKLTKILVSALLMTYYVILTPLYAFPDFSKLSIKPSISLSTLNVDRKLQDSKSQKSFSGITLGIEAQYNVRLPFIMLVPKAGINLSNISSKHTFNKQTALQSNETTTDVAIDKLSELYAGFHVPFYLKTKTKIPISYIYTSYSLSVLNYSYSPIPGIKGTPEKTPIHKLSFGCMLNPINSKHHLTLEWTLTQTFSESNSGNWRGEKITVQDNINIKHLSIGYMYIFKS